MRFHGSASKADAQRRSAARAVLQQLPRCHDLLNFLGSFWIRAQSLSDCNSILLAFVMNFEGWVCVLKKKILALRAFQG